MAVGKKTGGRTKGTPNKLTVKVKDAIAQAFDKVGGVDYLVKLAKDDPKTFCMLVGKIIPLEVTGADGGPIAVTEIRLVAPKGHDVS